MPSDTDYTFEMVGAVAVALYSYNVSPMERAKKLLAALAPDVEPDESYLSELVRKVQDPYWATGLGAQTAALYLQHAMERYETEAQNRLRARVAAPRREDYHPSRVCVCSHGEWSSECPVHGR